MNIFISKLISVLVIAALLFPVSIAQANVQQSLGAGSTSEVYRTRIPVEEVQEQQQLEALGFAPASQGQGWVEVLATSDQLEQLARLGFQPQQTMLLAGGENLQSPAIDSDADGLTDTQEAWWCTDLLNPDSDDDGITDGDEIQTLKEWVGNERDAPPFDTPWPTWPFNDTTCPDKDRDSIPNLAERYELGTNMDLESTDGDKFDDGQEVFGVTNCPGGELSCKYGSFPRSEDSGIVLPNMPGWVESPGNHPLVAAFPIPEIDIVEGSFNITTTSVITTDHEISKGTSTSYGSSTTQGTSVSDSETESWNEWEESYTTTPLSPQGMDGNTTQGVLPPDPTRCMNFPPGGWQAGCKIFTSVADFAADTCIRGGGLTAEGCKRGAKQRVEPIDAAYNAGKQKIVDGFTTVKEGVTDITNKTVDWVQNNLAFESCSAGLPPTISCSVKFKDQQVDNSANYVDRQAYGTGDGNTVTGIYSQQLYNASTSPTLATFYPLTYPSQAPVSTQTSGGGKSWGGAKTHTVASFEEHTLSTENSISDVESWGTATAVDSDHAADFWFSYTISNSGTEYAREISGLIFNVYIGDDPNPAYTYSVSPDIGGDGSFHNFMPDEQHTYTARHIPLTLEQMKTIDTGGKIRVVVEDFSYGADELFYENAAARSVQIAIEDGVEDGDEAIDNYLIPTWGTEAVLDVLARYFPHDVDEEGGLIAIWTPEYRADAPSWCADSYRTGATLWCKHALSSAEWWNVYSSGLGDGSEGFQDTPAAPGGVALFRFNQDSDLDGYSDRSEERMGTDPADTASFPHPELLAGLYAGPKNAQNQVVATLSLLNTGLYDAYGVEAVMIAPDDSITVTNNTVGGSGRVKAGKQVVVGSSISSPTLGIWTGTAKPISGGYFTGAANRSYTFTVVCGIPGGCDVGSGNWSLNWADNAGSGAALNDFDGGYGSPNLISVGSQGVKIGFLSGKVYNGNTFTVQAAIPRDTFQYTINRELHTAPVVIVSYNDPQGNHRFILPETAMALTAPTDNLAGFSGQMIQNPGIEIVTQESFLPGSNTTHLVVNNPSGKTLQNAHMFLEFIDPRGEVTTEVPVIQTLPPGPSTIPITWDSASFSPIYDPGQDYIVLAFLTDYQGNILDTAGRPLSSFQQDPRASLAMPDADAEWNFGEAAQNSLLQKTLTFANQGQQELLTYVIAPQGLSVSQTGSQRISPADLTRYDVTLNTAALPVGVYDQTITIRTSDPDNPQRSVRVTGTITAAPADVTQGPVQRPMDYSVTVPGPKSQGSWYSFEHPIGPDPQSLHPVKVFSQDYSKLWGVGKYATQFGGAGTASYEMFGDGSDGPLTVNAGQTLAINTVRTNVTGSGTSVTVSSSNGFKDGDLVLFHQSQGAVNVGRWEYNRISQITGNNLTLTSPLKYSYSSSDGRAQLIRVHQFTNLTIESGGVLTVGAWDGYTGGIVAFLVNDQLNVTGSIDVSGKGYRGFEKWISPGETGYQGENISGVHWQSISANNNGGGGGQGNGDGGAGGGGGSYASAGTYGSPRPGGGPQNGGPATLILGDDSLNQLFFGGAGGAGGSDDSAGTWSPYPCGMGGRGGAGGGIILASGARISIAGSIKADGNRGNDGGYLCSGGAGGGGGGGGGAAGAILLKASRANIGTSLVSAIGANGGNGVYAAGSGGAGGVGRVRVEYCENLFGSTNPVLSSQKLSCFITEQVDSPPYTSTQLNLPENISSTQTYAIQYGRRATLAAGMAQAAQLRVPAGLLSSATLDVLVSGVGSGTLNYKLDIGSDGTWDWQVSKAVTDSDSLPSPNLADAFNAYWATHGRPTTGTLDVPVTMWMNKAGQVLLTNLQTRSAPSTLRYVRADVGTYSSFAFQYTLSGLTGSGTVAIDVGGDGSVEDAWSGTIPHSLTRTSANLKDAVNAFMVGKTGEVDIPIRFYYAPSLTLKVDALLTTLSAKPDSAVSTADIHLPTGIIVEGDSIALSTTVRNPSSIAAPPVVASFFANTPDWGDWYLGSALVPRLGAGQSEVVTIAWDTEGFHGSVPVTVVLDPTERLEESSEANNAAQSTLVIRTRPDLLIDPIRLSDESPVVGEEITVSLDARNAGQTATGNSLLKLFEGDTATGTVLGQQEIAVAAGGTEPVTFTWMPGQPGWHRLTASSDAALTVTEGDEGNNTAWKDIYVGFAGPILLDSGSAAQDAAYSSTTGYGVIDSGAPDVLGDCGTTIDNTYRRGPDGQVQYQFEHLLPEHFYHLDITLYNCPGEPQRLENVLIDGLKIAGPVDISDNEVHRISIRLDPALYADRQITAVIEAPGNIYGAVVNAVNLHDIDYRYADAGGGNDPAYPGSQRFGYLDGSASAAWGNLPYQSVRVDSTDSEVTYRFDGLLPQKRYNAHITFYQGNATAQSALKVKVDGFDTGSTFYLTANQTNPTTVRIPPDYYKDDGSVAVSVVRLDSKGPFINEVALEEETIPGPDPCKAVQTTPYSSIAYGDVRINNQAAVPGTTIEALSKDGSVVGCFVTKNSGLYGYMPIYGKDSGTSPVIPGMEAEELVRFRVNGAPAFSSPALYWQDDPTARQVNLNLLPLVPQTLNLKSGWNLIGFNLEMPWPSLPIVLQPIAARYDRVLSEIGFYSTVTPPQFNTLKELYPGNGYYVRINGSTTVNLMVEGSPRPEGTAIPLHAGWNWISGPDQTLGVAEALGSIQGKYQLVRGIDKVYDPVRPQFSTLKEMKRGEGYHIYMTEAASLIYPAAGVNMTVVSPAEVVEGDACDGITRTPEAMMLFGTMQNALAGSTLEVRTPRGELAGCSVIGADGLLNYTMVYGSVEDSPGFLAGEPLTLLIDGQALVQDADPLLWTNFTAEQVSFIASAGEGDNTVYLPFVTIE